VEHTAFRDQHHSDWNVDVHKLGRRPRRNRITVAPRPVNRSALRLGGFKAGSDHNGEQPRPRRARCGAPSRELIEQRRGCLPRRDDDLLRERWSMVTRSLLCLEWTVSVAESDPLARFSQPSDLKRRACPISAQRRDANEEVSRAVHGSAHQTLRKPGDYSRIERCGEG